MKTLFLPGASGSASFRKPVADRAGIEGVFFSWPSLGLEPPQSDVNGLNDLVAMVANQITEPVNLISQSMGGLIAMKLALAMPTMVCRLVLTVTSGGVAIDNLADQIGEQTISLLSQRSRLGSSI